MPAINAKDFNPNHPPRERPVVAPRPVHTCSDCAGWRNIDARPRCVRECSPHYRQPREGSHGACDKFRKIGAPEPLPEPEIRSVIPPGSVKPPERPVKGFRNRRPRDAEHAAVFARNEQRKGG